MKVNLNFKNLPNLIFRKKYFLVLVGVIAIATLALAGYTAYNSQISDEERLERKQRKQLEDEFKVFENEFKLEPNSTPQQVYAYHLERSAYLARLGKNQESLEELQKAGSSGVALTYSYYISLGKAYEAVNNKPEAKTAYEKALTELEKDTSVDAETKDALKGGIKELIAGVSQ